VELSKAFLLSALVLIVSGCLSAGATEVRSPNAPFPLEVVAAVGNTTSVDINAGGYGFFGENGFIDNNGEMIFCDSQNPLCVTLKVLATVGGGGGAGVSYTGVLPVVTDNDANIVYLDVNALSDWAGLFDGNNSEYYVSWENFLNVPTAFPYGTPIGDANLATDFNSVFYKQIDANVLFALISDVNGADNLRILWTDGNLTYWKQADLNTWLPQNYSTILDTNGADNLRALITDVNKNFALISDVNGNYSLVSDTNGADALRILWVDANANFVPYNGADYDLQMGNNNILTDQDINVERNANIMGRMGVGTKAPTQLIEAYKAGTDNNLRITADAGQYAAIDTYSGTKLWQWAMRSTDNYLSLWEDGNTQRLTIKNGGNVGIGTTNPLYKLQVTGNSYFSGNINVGAYGHVTEYGLSPDIGIKYDSPGAAGGWYGVHDFYTGYNGAASTLAMRIKNGNVGIGTSSPSSILHTKAANTDLVGSFGNLYLTTSDALAADKGGTLSFGGIYSGSSQTQWAGIAGRKDNATDGQTGGYLQFFTRTNGASLGAGERMRITSDGNVGIGTTVPETSLSVKGSGTGYVNIGQLAQDTSFGGLSFTQIPADVNTQNYSFLGEGTHSYFNAPAGGNLYFRVGNVQKAILTSDGNLGIGKTVPKAKLDVYGGNAVGQNDALWLSGGGAAYESGPRLVFHEHFGSDAYPTWRLGEISGVYQAIGGKTYAGSLVFNVNDGDTVTDMFEAMRIHGNGNVGIGTTAPASRLQVKATADNTKPFSVIKANGNDAFSVWVDSGGDATFIMDGNAGTNIALRNDGITHFNGGNVCINCTSTNYKLDVRGDVNAYNIRATNDLNVNNDTIIIGDLGIGGIPLKPFHISDGNSVNSSFLTQSDIMLQSKQGTSAVFKMIAADDAVAGRRPSVMGSRSRGTLSTPTIIQDEDIIFSLIANPYDGDDTISTAWIDFIVDGSPSNEVIPTRIDFKTTETNEAGQLVRLRIESDGNINIAKNLIVDENINASGYRINENIGLTQTLYMRDKAGTGQCYMDINGGIITASDCT